jgi:hypothetical protein
VPQRKTHDRWWPALFGLMGLGLALALSIVILRLIIISHSRPGLIIAILIFIIVLYARGVFLKFIQNSIKILNEKK